MSAVRTSFWWDRSARASIDVSKVQGVIFSLDGVLSDARSDHELFSERVWDLYCAGVRIAVTTERGWLGVHRSVRELLGDGAVELIITGDEVSRPKPDPEVYHYALWELGLRAESVLAVEDSAHGLRAARAAGVATIVVTTERTEADDFTGAAAVLPGYDPLSISRG